MNLLVHSYTFLLITPDVRLEVPRSLLIVHFVKARALALVRYIMLVAGRAVQS